MNTKLLFTVCTSIAYLASVLNADDFNGTKWVVLAAASKAWYNYGDQVYFNRILYSSK